MQLITEINERSEKKKLITVLSETYGQVEDGPLSDFFDINNIDKFDSKYNISDHDYINGNKKIQFRAADKPGKLKVSKRDILYVNEANNISVNIYDQAEPRTRESIFIDFNPDHKFWAHELVGREDVWFDRSTYKDNHKTPPEIIKSIEKRKLTDPEWYRVYGEGRVGHFEGQIYKNWKVADLSKVQNHFDYCYYGQDFGYEDPKAFLKVAVRGNIIYILKEVVRTKMTNMKYVPLILPIVKTNHLACDHQKNDYMEFRELGVVGARAAYKGEVVHGIQWIKNYEIVVDKKCVNTIGELEKYKWLMNKDGESTGKPEDKNNHCLDALRYALGDLIRTRMAVKGMNLPI